MGIYWLPPYSPQCNPVEHLGNEIREKWFENRLFHSLNAVEDELVTSLVTLEKDSHTVAGLTGFEWIISITDIFWLWYISTEGQPLICRQFLRHN